MFVINLNCFKGNKAVELQAQGRHILFAFEEAIGFMCSPVVLDKDGVSAACHLATLCCYLEQNGNLSLTDKLNELYHTYGYHYTMNSYFICHDHKLIESIFDSIRFTNEKSIVRSDEIILISFNSE